MSIEYRGENRWRFRVTKNGKKFETPYYSTTIPKIKNNKTEISKEVKDAHDAYKADVQRDKIFSAERLTLDEMFDIVNKQYIKSLGDSTIILYNQMHKEHISPKFGKYLLIAISKLDIQEFINNKCETHAPRTVNLIFSILNLTFNKSIEWEILDKSPCTNIKLPEIEQNNYSQLLSEEEIAKLIFCYEKEPNTIHKLAFNLAFGCGMRMGEILGLKISDIDFKKSSISITRQHGAVLKNGKVRTGIKNPKTKNSIRKIYAPDFVLHSVKERMKEIKTIDPNSFIMKHGDAIVKSEYIRNYFKTTLKENGITEIRFHDLRHLKATIMLNSGSSTISVARTLGDRIDEVLKTYAHTIDEVEIEAAKEYENYISKTKIKNKHLS